MHDNGTELWKLYRLTCSMMTHAAQTKGEHFMQQLVSLYTRFISHRSQPLFVLSSAANITRSVLVWLRSSIPFLVVFAFTIVGFATGSALLQAKTTAAEFR